MGAMQSQGSGTLTSKYKRVTLFFTVVFAFVSLGLTPAFAADERVIDIVTVTWNGAGALAGSAQDVSKVVDQEVNAV
jgi:hypothetical protein